MICSNILKLNHKISKLEQVIHYLPLASFQAPLLKLKEYCIFIKSVTTIPFTTDHGFLQVKKH